MVSAVRRLTADQLRRSTLRRQFPVIQGSGPADVLKLFEKLGPIQSQVPRAPFLTAASRLPGVAYETVNDLLVEHQLVKASNLRGTVHTSPATSFGWLDAVARSTRERTLARAFDLTTLTPTQLTREIEQYCAQWRTRDEIVDHMRTWLTARNPASAAASGASGIDGLLWGHSGLLRRPRDGAWEKRTDIYRRAARTALGNYVEMDPQEALRQLVPRHLAAYGPVLGEDLAFFFGVPTRAITAVLRALGDRIVRLAGPDREDYLDLADPPEGGQEDPGLRLLPEFDGLLLGFQGRNRTRFVDEQQLSHIWLKVNGVFSPVVLYEGRLVATWKTIGPAQRVRVEVTMLHPYPLLRADLLEGPVRQTGRALGISITDVVIRRADVGT